MLSGLLPVVHRMLGAIIVSLAAAAGSQAAGYTLTTIADKLDRPWAVVQLPDESFLVTQRGGELLRVAQDGSSSQVSGVPPTYVAGQGGFFDIVLHPDFAANQITSIQIYMNKQILSLCLLAPMRQFIRRAYKHIRCKGRIFKAFCRCALLTRI